MRSRRPARYRARRARGDSRAACTSGTSRPAGRRSGRRRRRTAPTPSGSRARPRTAPSGAARSVVELLWVPRMCSRGPDVTLAPGRSKQSLGPWSVGDRHLVPLRSLDRGAEGTTERAGQSPAEKRRLRSKPLPVRADRISVIRPAFDITIASIAAVDRDASSCPNPIVRRAPTNRDPWSPTGSRARAASDREKCRAQCSRSAGSGREHLRPDGRPSRGLALAPSHASTREPPTGSS